MKIVGRIDGGYLAQITDDEIGVITGFGRYPTYGSEDKKAAFKKATGRDGRNNDAIPTNTIINVIGGIEYISGIRSRLLTAKKTARELREIADMLESPVPVAIMPPEDGE